jgi:GLPGLI family protein
MKKIILILIFTVTYPIYSQNFSGIVTYKFEHNLVIKTDTLKNEKVKSLIYKLLDNRKDNKTHFNLAFNKDMSSFKYYEKMGIENNSLNLLEIVAKSIGTVYTIHKKNHTLTNLPYSNILIDDSFSIFKWKLTQETKKIGDYMCYKATGVNKRIQKNDEYKSIEVIAWYTPEIPIRFGPSRYGGLPGLILELEENNAFKFSATKIKFKKRVKIFLPKLKKIKRDEFNKIYLKDYLKNLRLRG